MASITQRTKAGGKTYFFAQITRRKHGYTESRSFPTKKSAEAWAKRREAEIDFDIGSGRTPTRQSTFEPTLADAIEKYIAASVGDMGRTKAQVLRTIKTEYDIAQKKCERITAADIVSFAQQIANRPASPSTVGNYLSHLGSVIRHAPALWGFPFDKVELENALISAKHMGIMSKSNERSRIPSLDELDKLLTHFENASKQDKRIVPMHMVVLFALFSTRRQAEITRIKWADLDLDGKRIMVSGMKNPGRKGGIDTFCTLPDPCLDILNAIPKKSDRIFPYSTDVITRRFTDACKLLEIHDLHFHDLRRAGCTRLAEMGFTIPQITDVSGHRSWSSAQRYVGIRATGDKYKGWKWLDILKFKT